MSNSQFGVVGLAVMGRNLALNLLDHGVTVGGWNRNQELVKQAHQESGERMVAHASLESLVAGLERPRRLLLMVKAGAPVDSVIETVSPLLDPGDIVIDGGNSWFEDTRRREKTLRDKELHFVGMGVSGGEDGARFGPSLMPGGSAKAWASLEEVLTPIAADSDAGPCVTHVGPDGAGHFVKMVHNGIEYADMQCIAEAYDLLNRVGGLGASELAATFTEWNRGPLESFLIEITAKIFGVEDADGGPLVEQVLDKAGQKGTGRWTASVALELGVPVPSIAAAVDARILSSMKTERQVAATLLKAPPTPSTPPATVVQLVHDALYCAKIAAYAQGMALIAAGSKEYNWNVNLSEVARIWKAGCIIRARFLDPVRHAFSGEGTLDNLMLAQPFLDTLNNKTGALRSIVSTAAAHGIPVPGMNASLAYLDAYRTARLPQNLTQAQRDAFGAHTYRRAQDPNGPAIHTDWLG